MLSQRIKKNTSQLQHQGNNTKHNRIWAGLFFYTLHSINDTIHGAECTNSLTKKKKKNYQESQQDAADRRYLMELRKILVRKLLATWTSLSDGIVRGDTTSTILALRGPQAMEWEGGKEEEEEEELRYV